MRGWWKKRRGGRAPKKVGQCSHKGKVNQSRIRKWAHNKSWLAESVWGVKARNVVSERSIGNIKTMK